MGLHSSSISDYSIDHHSSHYKSFRQNLQADSNLELQNTLNFESSELFLVRISKASAGLNNGLTLRSFLSSSSLSYSSSNSLKNFTIASFVGFENILKIKRQYFTLFL